MPAVSPHPVLASLVTFVAAGSAQSMELKDPYFGEALFHAYQGHYFEALERLDTEIAQHYGVDEPQLDSLNPHIDHAEFSVGDFELYYRMHHRAGRAIKAVLEADVDEPVINVVVTSAEIPIAWMILTSDTPGFVIESLGDVAQDRIKPYLERTVGS